MHDAHRIAAEHVAVSRRYFLQLGAAGIAAIQLAPWLAGADEATEQAALADDLAKLEYLTKWDDFRLIERGEPLPYTHPIEKLREVGLTQETWKLEVVPDPDAKATMEKPFSKELGTALDWQGLMKLAETRAVRYLKVMTCNNMDTPLGMGLWEGVPLRNVIWLTQPSKNIRRVFYYGYHNDAPKQIFRSSLPIGRVLEDPPGENPVILCYKLNGQFLDGKRGGPVRMLVPDAYGFKSVKWLIRVVLTNAPFANDTYATGDNDIDSWMKTSARILTRPAKVKPGQSIPLTGIAQGGHIRIEQGAILAITARARVAKGRPLVHQGPVEGCRRSCRARALGWGARRRTPAAGDDRHRRRERQTCRLANAVFDRALGGLSPRHCGRQLPTPLPFDRCQWHRATAPASIPEIRGQRHPNASTDGRGRVAAATSSQLSRLQDSSTSGSSRAKKSAPGEAMMQLPSSAAKDAKWIQPLMKKYCLSEIPSARPAKRNSRQPADTCRLPSPSASPRTRTTRPAGETHLQAARRHTDGRLSCCKLAGGGGRVACSFP